MPGLMRLFVRVEGHTPFCLLLDDNLLPEHYNEIAIKYFKENWHSTRQAPELVLIRRTCFLNKDQMFDYRKRKRTIKPPPVVDTTKPNNVTMNNNPFGSAKVYETSNQPDLVRQELVVTNPPVPSLIAHCETELLVKSISLNRLIMKITDPMASSFLEDVFWNTYRAFSTPSEVLDKLIERYEVPPLVRLGQPQRSPLDEQLYDEVSLHVRLRVFACLEHWVERYFFDFADEVVYQKLVRFAREKIDKDSMPATINELMRQNDRTALENRKKPQPPGTLNISLSPSGVFSSFTPREIANQLTLLTLHVHNQLYPCELLGRQWEGPEANRVPNFINYRDFINRVCNWVSYSIISEKDNSLRAHNMAQLLFVCDELLKLNNWDMMVAVFSGINDPTVARLTNTAQALPSEAQPLLAKFEELLALRGASKMLKSAMASAQRPHFPSILVHLRDLLYLEETPVFNDGGLINFMRCIHQHNLVTFLLDGQGARLDMVPRPELQGVFSFWRIVDDKILQALSLEAQAR